MSLLPAADWRVATTIARIGYVNPFLPERIELERRALGHRYRDVGPVIRAHPGERMEDLFPNIPAMRERARTLVSEIRGRLEGGCSATRDELLVYEDLSLYLLYARYMSAFDGIVTTSLKRPGWTGQVPFWPEFLTDFERLFHPPGHELPSRHDPHVIFAGYFQIERAFSHVYRRIMGGSTPAAQLRAAVWQSIFTRDMRRYIRWLHKTMSDVPTLIVGPSGTGKEIVASAIAMSCYIPFLADKREFEGDVAKLYVPLNLAALPPTLIEAELFGHVKGAFSGDHKDRKGWLEECGEYGAVFLDEIGELDAAIQVKLLRVLECRQFQKVGDAETRTFKGKIIAATNRDLPTEIQAGRFRHDLYYRLCADQVVTPSLAEQLADRPEDLTEMVRFIAGQVLVKQTDDSDEVPLGPASDDGLAEEADRLVAEVVAWIECELGRDYAWPGNFRELGQCVRNVMIRGSYYPAKPQQERGGGPGPVEELLRRVRGVELTADELLGRYYALAYHRSNENYMAAARPLGVDWRVVKGRLDQTFLERLRHPSAAEIR